VVGVVLTGNPDDGAAGLLAVKKRGGIAVVRDPDNALFPGMPQSALKYVDVGYCLPLADIPPLLMSLARQPVKEEASSVSKEMEVESKIAGLDMSTNEEKMGTPSVFSCPECQGTLWELRDGDLTRFRCRVGHAFSIESMGAKQAEMLESALWAALRALEERANLERRLADQARQRNHKITPDRFGEKADMAECHAAQIRQILLNNKQSE
jgi:two-component system chemotaxis response regulator CheB